MVWFQFHFNQLNGVDKISDEKKESIPPMKQSTICTLEETPNIWQNQKIQPE